MIYTKSVEERVKEVLIGLIRQFEGKRIVFVDEENWAIPFKEKLEGACKELCQLFESKGEKPPVLSNDSVIAWLQEKRVKDGLYKGISVGKLSIIGHREAQRDADAAYYEPIIQQANHQRNSLATSLLSILRKVGMLNNDTEPGGAELIMFAENFCEHNPI